MARINRNRNPRSIHAFPGLENNDAPGATTSLTATTYSNPIYGPNETGKGSVHLAWSAGLTGNFTIQYSLAPFPEQTNDNDWVTDSSATVIGDSLTLAGSAGKAIIMFGNVLVEWFRIKWTHTSGAGTIEAYVRMDGVA